MVESPCIFSVVWVWWTIVCGVGSQENKRGEVSGPGKRLHRGSGGLAGVPFAGVDTSVASGDFDGAGVLFDAAPAAAGVDTSGVWDVTSGDEGRSVAQRRVREPVHGRASRGAVPA